MNPAGNSDVLRQFFKNTFLKMKFPVSANIDTHNPGKAKLWLDEYRSENIMTIVAGKSSFRMVKPSVAAEPFERDAMSIFEKIQMGIVPDKDLLEKIGSSWKTAAVVLENALDAVVLAKQLGKSQQIALEQALADLKADCIETFDRLTGYAKTIEEYQNEIEGFSARFAMIAGLFENLNKSVPQSTATITSTRSM